jgi:SAM-dependent methyltransferase
METNVLSKIISHGEESSVESLINRIKAQPPSCGIERGLELVEQLTKFEFGKFLIEHRGLNGAWTSYLALYPVKGRSAGLSSNGQPLSELEAWFLNRCPSVLATQERFRIFQEITQSNLKSCIQIASVPCGLMDDLLLLDYSGLDGVELTGVDLDIASLQAAEANYKNLDLEVSTHFEQSNALELSASERWDFITSNGLNIYMPDDDQVIQLYRRFFDSLKPGGQLLTSFLTPPPVLSSQSPWQVYDEADMKLLMVLSEILPTKCQCYRTEDQAISQLKEAGFDIKDIRYDGQKFFPTVLATKALISN